MTTTEWVSLFKAPRGHKYFKDAIGQVAVADDSGETPDRTDDGELYVMTELPVKIGQHATIHCVTAEGKPVTIMETAEAGLLVAAKLGMLVNAHGVDYRLVVDVKPQERPAC